MKDPHSIIKNPLIVEKAVRLMEAENKLTFLVALDANKRDIKEAVETIFKVKVEKVNTTITGKAIKKAFVKISLDTPAQEIVSGMGLS